MARRSILKSLLSPIASTLVGWLGGYNATDPRRKILDPRQLLAAKTTANQLLNGNLASLRAYCRNLERNNPTARAGIEALKALVVGSGIALEPDTGDETLDKRIRDLFNDWCEHAGIHGESIWQLQAMGMGEQVTAGEGLWRLVDVPGAMRGDIPVRILPYDAEWLRDDIAGNDPDTAITTVAGVRVDRFGRPVAYLLANPENETKPEEVPAKSIIHFFERRRPIQNRGEPWLAPLIESLITERDLVDAELKAAVLTASLGIAIESEYHGTDDTEDDDADPAAKVALGSVVRLLPGDKVHPFGHTRPSQQIAPFRQMLRGDIAAALRIPQRFLDRDVRGANYSSMRADMVDTERILGPVREAFGKQSIGEAYTRLLPLMAAMLGVQMPRGNYRLIPDGQAYVDPQKDAQAALTAIAGGLSTYEAEIGKRGGDYRQVWEQLAKEREHLEDMGLRPIVPQGITIDAEAPTTTSVTVKDADQ